MNKLIGTIIAAPFIYLMLWATSPHWVYFVKSFFQHDILLNIVGVIILMLDFIGLGILVLAPIVAVYLLIYYIVNKKGEENV